jgi:hypothetical protein
MSESNIPSLALETYFRANPNYELVSLGYLESVGQQMLTKALRSDPEITSVLRPFITGLRFKAICNTTAELFTKLSVPAKIPDALAKNPVVVMQLVLDDVLQIQSFDGSFVSGAEAYPLFLPISKEFVGESDSISSRAIQYGAMLNIDNPHTLAMRLYCYNRRPLTPIWWQRCLYPEQLLLDLTSGIGDLDQHWVNVPPNPDNPNWFVWRSRMGDSREHRLVYKLYIAPCVEELSETMRRSFPILAACGANSVKVGNSAVGVLRPDKLVAYFDDQTALRSAADALGPRLRDITPQPVPFTCQLDSLGVLSWGVDPPKDVSRLPWEGASWRVWVTMRLALALVDAQRANSALPAWQYAFNRVRLDGIDPVTWSPEGVFT